VRQGIFAMPANKLAASFAGRALPAS